MSAAEAPQDTGAARRVALRIDGVVQGVGFRPFVFRLAEEHGLAGHVLNDSRGVLCEVEGPGDVVEVFVEEIATRAPPLAHVEEVRIEERAPTGEEGFAIVASDRIGSPDALVSADSATCDDCLAEMRDPADRRHRYPFINCTNCGPRFTIVRAVPYDRPLTTMADFEMCEACRAEYEDPRDRRFHAQPNACPECGPRARLVGADDDAGGDAVAAAARLLRDGAIVGVKGLGGYHLACRADDEDAVAALRSRKHREDRPFALMVGDAEAARRLVVLGEPEERLLVSPVRPIVLAPRRDGSDSVAPSVAPRAPDLGVLLPYSPLHHLLLGDAGVPLVMTSGNLSDEPIAHEDDDAARRLGGIADALLVHDRPIHMRTDDSVVRTRRGAPVLLRRSRGHVPDGLRLPVPAGRDVLAVGAELKSTFTVARGARAWVSHHIGDLSNVETLTSFTSAIAHFERLFAVHPRLVAHDLHPDYLSTRDALARVHVETMGVQHHHAHLAACLAEHGETGPAVGAIYDGTGLGTDGTVWGGEILAGDLVAFTRAGALSPVRLPGGDRAVREPWRMACAWLVAAGDEDEVGIPAALAGVVDETAWRNVVRLARSGVAAPVTTSMGRLFDAVAALCGVRTHVTYEGQAAAELEGVATGAGPSGAYEMPVAEDGTLDARPLVDRVAADIARGEPPGAVAARVHAGIAAATAVACGRAASAAGTERVVLAGGVFQNRLLLDLTVAELEGAGLRPLVPERLPPNDGAISFGQAAIAAARTAAS